MNSSEHMLTTIAVQNKCLAVKISQYAQWNAKLTMENKWRDKFTSLLLSYLMVIYQSNLQSEYLDAAVG